MLMPKIGFVRRLLTSALGSSQRFTTVQVLVFASSGSTIKQLRLRLNFDFRDETIELIAVKILPHLHFELQCEEVESYPLLTELLDRPESSKHS